MIGFSNSFQATWNKKIIYAPNGFGKTTNSNKLYTFCLNAGFRPLIFTRKSIEELIKSYGNIVYFGKTAINAEENKKIVDEYSKTDTVKKYFKDNYGTYSIKTLKEKSFFIRAFEFKKLDNFAEILKLKYNEKDIFNEDESIELDKKLDYELYNLVSELLDSKDMIKKEKKYKRLEIVDDKIFESLDALIELAKNNDKLRCPLCGKKFKSKEKLIEAIEKKKGTYRLVEKNNLYGLLSNVNIRIHNLYYNDDIIHDVLYNFDEDLLTSIEGMIRLITNYQQLCIKVGLSMCNYFGEIEINSDRISELAKKYIENETKISTEKSDITNVNSFTKFIIKELKKIIYADNSISFDSIPNKLEVVVKFEDGKLVQDLYDVLSESEVKRFSLVVLRALIKYGKYDTLVLDDPIDSYDDYYLLVACDYIKNIVSENKLLNWYILTNNFSALSNISSILKCDSIIYYYNPDDIFTTNNFSISSFIANYKEIEIISKNELKLLNDYLNGKLNSDMNLTYISMIVTLRNFKSLVLKKYDKLTIKKGIKIYGTIAGYESDLDYNNNIREIVEHYYMHYDEDVSPSLMVNSNNIEVFRIIDLYSRICTINTSLTTTFSTDSTSLCNLRENMALTSFNSFTGSKIINLIFHKICIVSYLKYEFEKQLIIKLKNKYSYSSSDIKTICSTFSLAQKILKAKDLNKINSYHAEDYLNEYHNVFDGNKLLFNLFDHALEQMFPPYIATNVKDIKKFKLEIDMLDSKY